MIKEKKERVIKLKKLKIVKEKKEKPELILSKTIKKYKK
jgi:hypothetical protein